ncbi:tRNA epoxyqueuosine(34) reductase QueG [Paenibacillus tarimensis]|uniref:tRNA epoxyqueuosine(34) reductase QueG n=1 Tax=Paenibacillus tarimensis TaxID=416012 RepID=UPI001F3BE073|nr:tRNA epoxyqueuosine(34) reductase QueG [Paenibacillus tarimensis]MCF2946405.1 tRNA epoxyqueuosine(34) reductase QueG [Paenibacillus tarimensis]
MPEGQTTDRYYQQLKEELLQALPELGIDKLGIASPEPFTALKERLIRHRELGRESGFEEPDLDKRTNPALLFDRPQSIIAIAIAYPSKLQDAPKSEPGARRGILSRSAWGMDYHHVLRDRLARLERWLRERVPELRAESMVDTGELVDRAVAERAGIGWSGKNCAVITPEFGSWVYLGEMITNLPLPPDKPVTDQCGTCTKCIDACPTGALVGPGELDAQRCVSFITQTKGFVSDEMMRKIGNRLYGCDTCQIVCPVNKGLNWTHQPELQPDPEKVKPLLVPLLTMGNRAFKEAYGSSASAWRGRKPIQRNAVIALGNFKDPSAIEPLRDVLLQDPRPELRGTAAWSLGRIGGQKAADVLEEALGRESDEQALTMIKESLEGLSMTAGDRAGEAGDRDREGV